MNTIHRALKAWGDLLFVADVRFYEGMMGALYFWWGYDLLVGRPNLFTSSPAYNPLLQNAPQVAWGTGFLLAGVCLYYGLLLGGKRVRMAGELLGVFLWLVICAAFLLAGASPTAVVLYLVFGFTSALSALRHARRGVRGL